MKNSLACVIFKEKNQQFLQLFSGSLKNGKIIKRYLIRKPWLFYRVENKLILISKYNKTIDKIIRGKQKLLIISDCSIRTDFLTALSLSLFFQSK